VGPGPGQDRYNSEDSLEDNQSTTSSTESRQSDFQRKASDQEFIPTRSTGILASKPAANPAQFTRINSNPLLISAQKQLMLVEEAKKKKKEQERKQIVGDDTPDWQSNLDGWKLRRRKQSEDAIERLTEMKRFGDDTGENGNRKSSISRKISAQYGNDDEIDFSDLNFEDDPAASSAAAVSGQDTGSDSDLSVGGGPRSGRDRRESRGVSQEKVIPEEDEEDSSLSEAREPPVSSSPYDSAIEGYRSFAKSRLNGAQDTAPVTQPGDVRDSSDRSPVSTLSHSASTSSMSPAPAPVTRNNDAAKNDTVDWEEKIESFVQPARRVSSEISNKMKEKLANFEDSKSGKEATPVRMIEPDNSFKDKLKAFKTIENSSGEPAGSGSKPMSRRESEPALMMHNNTKPKGMPSYRSTSSSFMNTFQNNKFFQQQQKSSQMENEIDKQEREIIESLEREEKEHKKYLASNPSGLESSSVVVARGSRSQSDLQQAATATTGTQHSSGQEQVRGWRKSESAASVAAKGAAEAPRKRSEGKDYNKHWLIQEAEQRRISEAKQKQNQPQHLDKLENINNNNNSSNGHEFPDYDDKRVHNNISDNIYANVDVTTLNYNKNHNNHSSSPGPPAGPLAGPQVPPRLVGGATTTGQDRVLSVSGKKKCSHCKEELGRGAAMIIESLRLFYHIRCFKCCVCSIQLGNGETGTDVRVRNNRLHCQNCYSNDEGLKFSKV